MRRILGKRIFAEEYTYTLYIYDTSMCIYTSLDNEVYDIFTCFGGLIRINLYIQVKNCCCTKYDFFIFLDMKRFVEFIQIIFDMSQVFPLN